MIADIYEHKLRRAITADQTHFFTISEWRAARVREFVQSWAAPQLLTGCMWNARPELEVLVVMLGPYLRLVTVSARDHTTTGTSSLISSSFLGKR